MWLLGPSSKILHRLLGENKIYPYFTDLFKKPFKNEVGEDTNNPRDKNGKPYYTDLTEKAEILRKEIELVSPSMVVLLGKYEEFAEIELFLEKQGTKHFSVWHPSWVIRYNHYDRWNAEFKIKYSSKTGGFESRVIWNKEHISAGHGIEVVFIEEARPITIAWIRECWDQPKDKTVIEVLSSSSKTVSQKSGQPILTEFVEAIVSFLSSRMLPRDLEKVGTRKQFVCYWNC